MTLLKAYLTPVQAEWDQTEAKWPCEDKKNNKEDPENKNDKLSDTVKVRYNAQLQH